MVEKLDKAKRKVSKISSTRTSVVQDKDGVDLIKVNFSSNPYNYSDKMNSIRDEFDLKTIEPESDQLSFGRQDDGSYTLYLGKR